MKIRSMRPTVGSALIGCLALVGGCATQIRVTPEMAGISTGAMGTLVMFDDDPIENAPCHFHLNGQRHQLIIRMAGYETYSVELQRNARVWTVEGTLMGDFVGIAVDAESGGVYKLTKDDFLRAYKHEAIVMLPREHTLSVLSVFKAHPLWTRIADLTPSRPSTTPPPPSDTSHSVLRPSQ